MDWQNIGWLAVFVLVGGAIAYGADNLGRKLGKKRLSLGGLRPRHTAAVVTVGAGMLTALLTIVLMLAVSSDLRTALLQGRELLHDVEDLKTELDTRQGEYVRVGNEVREKTKSLGALQTQANKLRAKVADLNKQVTDAQKISALQMMRVNSLTNDISAKTSLIARKTSEIEAKQKEVAKLANSVSKLKADYATQNTALKQAFEQNKELVDKQTALSTEITQKQSAVDGLTTEINALKSQREDLQSQLTTTQAQLAKAGDELTKTQQLVTTAQNELSNVTATLKLNVAVSRTQRVIYNSGDEVARVYLDPKLTEGQVRDALSALFLAARTEAKSRGAGTGQLGAYAGLYALEDTRTHQMVTVDDQVDAIVASLKNDFSPMVLVAYSTYNTFMGEPVLLMVSRFPNTYVYRGGETIAETRLDGRQEPYDIYRQITAFLTSEVRMKALKDQMLPRIGSEQSLGEVTDKEIMELVMKVHDEGRIIRLAAQAKNDTRRGDPLELNFKIKY